MKTQRRHELQTNELADHLGKYLQSLVPYRHIIGLVALGIVAAIFAALYLASQNRTRAASSWSEYFDAFSAADPTALDQVADAHQDAPAGLWARQLAGDFRLAEGSGLRLSDKKEAEKRLRDAIADFEAVQAGAGDNAMLRHRALFGLARAHEALCNLDKAGEYYRQVAQAEPTSALGKAAARQVEDLAKNSMKRWYGWFERQELVPPAPPAGAGEVSGLPEAGINPPTAGPRTPASAKPAVQPQPSPESTPGPLLEGPTPPEAETAPPAMSTEAAEAQPVVAPATGKPAEGTGDAGTSSAVAPARGESKAEPANAAPPSSPAEETSSASPTPAEGANEAAPPSAGEP